jgi:hypothetical protein
MSSLAEEEIQKLDSRLQSLLETSKRQQIVQNMYYAQESVVDASQRASEAEKASQN